LLSRSSLTSEMVKEGEGHTEASKVVELQAF